VAEWALALMGAYLVLAFGVRVAVALRTTGQSGIKIGNAPPVEVLGGLLFFAGVALGALNPLLAVADSIEPWDELDKTAAHVAGIALVVIGIAGTFVAQMQMGASWRIGVDPGERTELVTDGLFRHSRNPIYAFMLLAWLGFGLLVPTWLMLGAGVLLIVGLEIQVRLVEEPHMRRIAGERYMAWAREVGRFVPGLGRLG
jgi:protein-S-isoprenylcysteine O-methyltransferase Ste14